MLLINLVGNAFKYTRDNSDRRILIDYGETQRGEAFCVRDNGVGFERAYADRLFVAFERVEDTTSAEGIGLGLTIAARVIERHGGMIWAEGEPGEGATFYFSLPDG
jgi:signal transduction histidine kinase